MLVLVVVIVDGCLLSLLLSTAINFISVVIGTIVSDMTILLVLLLLA